MSIGLGLSLTKTRSPLGGFDADAKIYIDALTTAGFNNTQSLALYSISQSATNTLIDDFVLGIKEDSLFNKLKPGLWLKIGGTAATHKINFFTPGTDDISYVNAPTQGVNGTTYNGTTQHGDLIIVPSTDLTADNVHMMVYSHTEASASVIEMGIIQSSGMRLFLQLRKVGALLSQIYRASDGVNVLNSTSLGMFIGSRITSTDMRGFGNGSQLGSTNTGARTGTVPTISCYEGATNPAANHAAKALSCVSLGLGLTTTDVTNYTTRLNALQTGLGRNEF